MSFSLLIPMNVNPCTRWPGEREHRTHIVKKECYPNNASGTPNIFPFDD
jgi:hypothetical protein